MQKLILSFGRRSPAAIKQVKRLSFPHLCKLLTEDPPIVTDKAARGWFCPVHFDPPYRDSENFVHRYALTFDFDEASFDTWDAIIDRFSANAYVMYTTFSHTDWLPRFRLVMPLSRPAGYDEFQAVSRKIGAKIGIETMARESHVPSQMTYLPTIEKGGEFLFAAKPEGRPINVDRILAHYIDWTDRTAWPHRIERDGVHKAGELQTPPTEKPGPIGAFCRQYDIPAAIVAFDLPYTEVSDDRWTYTAGSRPEGAIVYDSASKLHSHHDTDPARGQHNAFDLVRLHRFHDLDAGADSATPVNELPSYAAMVDLALADEAVAAAEAHSEFQDLGPDLSMPEVPKPKNGLARKLDEVFRHPTEPRWLIRDEIERGVIAVMAGPRGSYKSFLALDWAMRVAVSGAEVYVISAEGADFDRRAAAWMQGHEPEKSVEEIPLYVVERRLDLSKADGLNAIIEDVKKLKIKPQLIVLDTWSKLSGGLDENDNTAVKQFIGRIDNGFKRRFDSTVLLIAHTGHSDLGRPRGASAFAADTDAEYIVTRRDGSNIVSLSRERFKASAVLAPLAYESEVIDLGRVDSDGEPITSLVMRKVEYRESFNTRKKPRGMWGAAALKTLRALSDKQSVVTIVELHDAIVATNPELDPVLSRKQAANAVSALCAEEWAFRNGNEISLTQAVRVEDEFAYLN